MRLKVVLVLLTRYSNRCQSAGCSFAKSIFLVALAFGNGASRSDRGLCPLRFGFASLAHIATYLSIGLILFLPFITLWGVSHRRTPVELKTSVIIPCYSKHFLMITDLLEQLENQTVLPDEVVICLTKHQVADIPKSAFERVESRRWPFGLKIVYADKGYPGAARNEACGNSSGDLLICQDADDIPHPQRIEIVKHLFENFEIDLLVHRWIPPKSTFSSYTLEESESRLSSYSMIDEFDEGAYIHHGNACLLRAVYDKIQWSISPTGEDHRFVRTAFRYFSGGIFLLDESLIIYRTELSSYGQRYRPAK
jgi:hypothetical protein